MDDYVSMPLVVQDDFTIEAWIKTAPGYTIKGNNIDQWYNGNGIVDGEVGGVTNDFGTSITGTKFAFGTGSPDTTIQSKSDVTKGEWIHVAATREKKSGSLKLYINGDLEAEGTGNTISLTVPPALLISSDNGTRGFFKGTIDEVLIYNRVLTEKEIKQDMKPRAVEKEGKLATTWSCIKARCW